MKYMNEFYSSEIKVPMDQQIYNFITIPALHVNIKFGKANPI